MQKQKITVEQLRAHITSSLVNTISSDSKSLRGFFRAPNGDIIVVSPFFTCIIENLEVVNMPQDKCWYSIEDDACVDFYPFDAPEEVIRSVVDDFPLAGKADFIFNNVLAKMHCLDRVEINRSRTVIAERPFGQNEFPFIFEGIGDDKLPFKIMKGKKVKLSIDSFNRFGGRIDIGAPYIGVSLKEIGDEYEIDISKKAGYWNLGIYTPVIKSDRVAGQRGIMLDDGAGRSRDYIINSAFWSPSDFPTQESLFDKMLEELIEPSNSYVELPGGIKMYSSAHFDTNILYSALKIMMLAQPKYISFLNAPDIDENVQMKEQTSLVVGDRGKSESITRLRSRFESFKGNGVNVKIIIGQLNQNYGYQRR